MSSQEIVFQLTVIENTYLKRSKVSSEQILVHRSKILLDAVLLEATRNGLDEPPVLIKTLLNISIIRRFLRCVTSSTHIIIGIVEFLR